MMNNNAIMEHRRPWTAHQMWVLALTSAPTSNEVMDNSLNFHETQMLMCKMGSWITSVVLKLERVPESTGGLVKM